MEELVQFRLLSSRLSVDEYCTVLSNVVNETNMTEFSSMIFNHFYQKLRKQNVEDTSDSAGLRMDTINREIYNVISQRNSNENSIDVCDKDSDDETESVSSEPLQITYFTDVIIQEIASYLPFKSYSKFQSCNRSIFVAINTQPTLQELEMDVSIKDCIHNDDNSYQIAAFMKRFARIQKLTIGYHNRKYIPFIKFHHLKQLDLNATKKELAGFLSKNTFNWDSIDKLHVGGKYALEIIRRCKNLTTLHIYNCRDDYHNTISKQLADLACVQRLQCLVLERGNDNIDTRIVLRKTGNTLQSLAIHPASHKLDGITFDSLVELRLGYVSSPNDIASIIKQTKQLRRIGIGAFLCFTCALTGPKCSDFTMDFEQLFGLDTLQYCYMQSDVSYLSGIVKLIETSLKQVKKQREILKLELDFGGSMYTLGDMGKELDLGLVVDTSMIHQINNVMNALQSWYRHFMLILVFEVEELQAVSQWLDSLLNTFSEVYSHQAGEVKVIISNNCSAFS
eukprot:148187_1